MIRTPRTRSRPSVRSGRFVLALMVVALSPGGAAAQVTPPAPPAPPAPPVAPDAPGVRGHGGMAGAACGRELGRVPDAPRAPGRSRNPGRGYLGLRLSEVAEVRWTGEGRLVRYCAYPLVVSVEPASPAEQAGVGAGDTLVAYGGRDLVRDAPIPLDQLLVPGERVRIRLRRDGRTLTRAVVVGERPGASVWTFGAGAAHPPGGPGRAWSDGGWPDGGWPDRRWRVPEAVPSSSGEHGGRDEPNDERAVRVRVFTPGRVAVAPPAPGRLGPPDVERLVLDAFGRDGFARGAVGRDVLERARAGDAPWVTYLRALPPLPPSTWATYGPAALAGAQLVALDDDLRDAVTGAPPRGVFVLKVLPGTPAAEAGLRAGDVITGAAGRPVHTPAALQRALASRAAGVRRKAERPPDGAPRPDDRTVTLRVARGGAARDVVLRW